MLTLASVLLRLGALIAGLMGMNFKVGLFEQAEYFWLVLTAIACIAVGTLAIVRAKNWI